MRARALAGVAVSFVSMPFAALLGYSERVDACGGLFCSGTSPVDQAAEQVLFEVEPDGSITATVQIEYSGDPNAFSWIIPVHGTPDFVDVAPGQLFRWLDATTRPSLFPPPSTCDDFAVEADGGGNAPPSADTDPGVDVREYEDVGPYDEIVVVDGADPEALVAWLTEHGYLVTDAMRPVIQEYAAERQKFLAMRLQPGVDVTQIVPVRFHCPNPLPVVPSRLTSLAAEPHMGMIVTVMASSRYTPSNWIETALNEDEIVWDFMNWRSNYTTAVALRVDQAGGRAFVVERAGDSAFVKDLVDNQIANNTWDGQYQGDPADLEVAQFIGDLVGRQPYLTRFYTRVSAEEMTEDPMFRAAPELGDVDGVIDLSQRAPVDVCSNENPAPTPSPCAFLYCGEGAQCGLDAQGLAGCACAPGYAARTVTSPVSGGFGFGGGGTDVACVDERTNVMDLQEAGCAGVTCGGRGRCSAINGVAACACDAGSIAIPSAFEAGGVSCVEAVDMRGNDDILRERSGLLGVPRTMCGATGSAPLAAFAMLMGLVLMRRRR